MNRPPDDEPNVTPSPQMETLVKQVRTTKHALNNLLMGLMGQVEILSGLPEVPDEVRARLEKVMSQLRRLRDEIRNLESIR